MPSDPLDAALGGLQPVGSFFYRSELSGPWSFTTHGDEVTFHYVEGGRCWLSVADEAVELVGGDLAVVASGVPVGFHDDPARPAAPLADVLAAHPPGPDGVLRLGAGAGPTALVCGGVSFDDAVEHPALGALPPLLVVRAADDEPWLSSTLAFLACESRSRRPGAATVMGHLASVVFLQAVRASLDRIGDRVGWLGALTDPHVGPAVRAIQRAPQRPWTVAALGREAGLGRSAFAARFRSAVGEPPMRHVARWRAWRAARLLRSEATLAEAAAGVGYESEAAFSRAFKRWTGRTPGEVRRAA